MDETKIAKALSVLWSHFRSWEWTMPLIRKNGTMKRWHLGTKCHALIKHDRILRGEH
ncbi:MULTISPECIES: hypothetical protein [Pseudomonas]|uniref:hypothetical protein n=1 Tax=Pseudomonas TaxID=286 RepID=UPI0018D6C361|nr:hypothetical protein [Pseudomonas sp. URMO17WK12:I11]MBH3364801.1 hypothetical protein [Pseudomonas sp. URMO17WK12:I11]